MAGYKNYLRKIFYGEKLEMVEVVKETFGLDESFICEHDLFILPTSSIMIVFIILTTHISDLYLFAIHVPSSHPSYILKLFLFLI